MRLFEFSRSLYNYIEKNHSYLDPQIRFDTDKTWNSPDAGIEVVIFHPSKDCYLSIISVRTTLCAYIRIRTQVLYKQSSQFAKETFNLRSLAFIIEEFLR